MPMTRAPGNWVSSLPRTWQRPCKARPSTLSPRTRSGTIRNWRKRSRAARIRHRPGTLPDRNCQTGGCGPARPGVHRTGRLIHLRRTARPALLPGGPAARRSAPRFCHHRRDCGRTRPRNWKAASASLVMDKLAASVKAFSGLSYRRLAEIDRPVAHRRSRRPVLRRHNLREQAGSGCALWP